MPSGVGIIRLIKALNIVVFDNIILAWLMILYIIHLKRDGVKWVKTPIVVKNPI